MSLYRFVYYSGVMGGWAALLAWILAEGLILRGSDKLGTLQVAIFGALAGAVIGAALNLVSGMTNAQWKQQILRLVPGLIGGTIGGGIGGLLGNLLFTSLGLPTVLGRAVGWMIMGLAIGSAEGIYDGSPRKCRNGAIGGVLGGLLGGLLFDPILHLTASGSGMAARATALVILGMSVGTLVGLAQVVLCDAWVTVVDGFRPGRQLILSQAVTALGRGDHLPLPLLGYAGRDLESEHARIIRSGDGSYFLEDNRSRLGTLLNNRPIAGPTPLSDGDLIKLGSNILRYNHRRGGGRPSAATMVATSSPRASRSASAAGTSPPPPPPPPPATGRPIGPARVTPPPARVTPPSTAAAPPKARLTPPMAKPANPRIPPPPPPPPAR